MSSNGNAAAKAANAATKAAANANAAAKAAKAAANANAAAKAAKDAAQRQSDTNDARARYREMELKEEAERNMHNWTSALRGMVRENKRFTEAQVAKMAASNKAAGGGGTRRRKSRKNRKTRSRR